MNPNLMLLSIVGVPIIGAFLTPLAGRFSKGARNIFSFLVVLVPLILVLRLIPAVLSGLKPTFIRTGVLGFDFVLAADGLAVFMAAVSAILSAVIVLYSFGYISHYENQNEYYFMVVLFFGAMMGLVFSRKRKIFSRQIRRFWLRYLARWPCSSVF
ncbi:MAG: hypothetical protein NT033_08595 [Candidatus Omnitrophica bacterium]|nr:hypothetical protein [Candidatus Omnitrophota bacterium]